MKLRKLEELHTEEVDSHMQNILRALERAHENLHRTIVRRATQRSRCDAAAVPAEAAGQVLRACHIGREADHRLAFAKR